MIMILLMLKDQISEPELKIHNELAISQGNDRH